MSKENWMKELPIILQTTPFIYLAIPGSHDTMTYGIKKNSGIAPDASSQVRFLGRIFGPLVKRIVYNWSVTQNLNVTDQLKMGVRYLDLRVSSKPHDNSMYFVHALYASEVRTRLEEIKIFLDHHSSECIILDFQHFYRFSKDNHLQLIQMIEEIFSYRLCQRPHPITNLTLKWMWSQGYQVIVIYRNDIIFNIDKTRDFWSSSLWPTFWPDTTSISKLTEYCDNVLAHRENYFGFITQCLITPDAKFVTKNIFSNLYEKCVRPCNTVMKRWIENKQAGEHGVNIVIADFISLDGFNFCNDIIELNKKLSENLIKQQQNKISRNMLHNENKNNLAVLL